MAAEYDWERIAALKQRTHNGFKFIYIDDDGAIVFQKEVNHKFHVVRCLPDDLTNGNFEWFADHGYTNTNPVPKHQRPVH